MQERWLMLQCVECGQHATVEEPSLEEWSQAFFAPSRPYLWHDGSRVRFKGDRTPGRFYIMRTGGGQTCECYEQFGVIKPGPYERVPAEITRCTEVLTDDERAELMKLADFVSGTDLCSRFFLLFLQSFQQHTRREVPGAAYRIARRIEEIDAKGLHCSASVVARVLTDYATGGSDQQ
jgi:hypothetical protein